jgi:4-aminobutyrate aminotransferase-like enzyme
MVLSIIRYWLSRSAASAVLLVADEVITGFGRTGAWWGSQTFGLEPDMIT